VSQAIADRVANGQLHRVHRGVYAVGHTVLTTRGRWVAAVLAAGPGAVLSHASAAALWELRPSAARPSTSPSPDARAARSAAGCAFTAHARSRPTR
jgi:anti-sigma factor ChrR (cupin superfamily)